MSKLDDIIADFNSYQSLVVAEIADLKAKVSAIQTAPVGTSDEQLQTVIDLIDAAKAKLDVPPVVAPVAEAPPVV